MACAHITKVAGRHAERDLLVVAFRHLQVAGNVVHNLREQTSPVNGVDRTNRVLGFKRRVPVDFLDHILAVIKHAIERDVENVRVIQTKHLRLLERRHAPRRGEHEHADAVTATHGVLRRRARITGGGAQDVDLLAAAAQLKLEQLAEQLHRHVLKRRGRTLRQVGDVELVILQARHRHDLLVGKLAALGGVRLRRELLNHLRRNIVHVQLEHLGS